jgi:hypothetical protein
MDKPISFTGLWKRTSKSGLEYLSASCDVAALINRLKQIKTTRVNVLAFKNTKRAGKQDPDWTINLGEYVERQQESKPQPPVDDGPGF